MSPSREIRAAGRLAGDVLAGVVDTVREVHRAVARRAFAAVGPAAAPVRALHDGITDGVYGVVRRAHAILPRGAAAVAAAGASLAEQPPPSASLPAGLVLAVLNGLGGDTLARRHPELALPMSVRVRGGDVPITAAGLTAAYPAATARMAVFVPGLCETEQYWALSARRHYGTEHSTHGSRLQRDLGYTPVYVRYNSGLHVSDNGARLARLLDELVAGWPVPVAEIVLIGHSMGGLVARSACHHAEVGSYPCAPLIRHVFCLGTPHLGAPLEKGVNAATWVLARVPESRPLARLANRRSAGVKDLRYGALVEQDWRDCDPDEFLRDRCTEVPFLPHTAYYFIGTTVTSQRDHPLASIIGDLFVQFPSASGTGRRRRIPFAVDNGRHLGGLHHFDLLNHPDVYHQIRTWLSRAGDGAGAQQPAHTR
jgi:pimeloyl-ACP methyl ester carboxylesterase